MTNKIEQTFRTIYKDVGAGNLVSPRGQPVIEIEDYSYTLPPYARFANFGARKLKLDYVRKELLWYFRANPLDSSIVDAASIWQELPNSDGSINSNYGAHVFGKRYEPVVHPSARYEDYHFDEPFNSVSVGALAYTSQLDYIVKTLLSDKDSRRASAVILNRAHLLSPQTKDYPCTYALNFRIRNNELKMSVHMRSQDAVFGMGNDAPAFSVIQELVFVLLRDGGYPDLKMGSYHHTADSFHYYERHFAMVKTINAGDSYEDIELPKIRDGREAIFLLTGIHQTYAEGNKAISYHATRSGCNTLEQLSSAFGVTINTPPTGDFSRWLTQGLS